MLSFRACKILVPAVALAGALTAVPAHATRTHRAATSGHSKKAKKKSASHQMHGQRQIDPGRAREIQSALIREHYLTGEPSGEWDADSQSAMAKFQADQGWQTKLTPDSRALIKLGLGPNPESAKPLQAGNQTSAPLDASHPPQPVSRTNSLASPQALVQ